MKNTCLQFTKTISAISILLLSLDLQAQMVAFTPSSKWLSEINKGVNQIGFEFEKSTQLNLPIPGGSVVSEQVDLVGRFTVLRIEKNQNDPSFTAEISLESAELLAKDVQVAAAIQQDLGFGSATMNLNLQCAAVTLRLARPQNFKVFISKDFQVGQIDTVIDHTAIQTGMAGCNDIPGADGLIQQHVLNYLKRQLLNQEIHQAMSTEIQAQVAGKFRNVGEKALGKNFLGSKMQIDQNLNLWFFIGENSERIFSEKELDSLSNSPTTTILLKKSYIEKEIKAFLNDQLIKSPISSKQISDLQRLTCSRLTQLFVWPSLKAFPKCFELKLVSQVKDLQLTDINKMQFTVQTQTWAQAPEHNKDIAYFQSKAVISLNPAYAQLTSFGGQHYPDFLSWSGRSSRISTNRLESAFQNYLGMKVQEISKNQSSIEVFRIIDLKKLKQIGSDTIIVPLTN